MLTATCHRGAVRVEVPRRPRSLTNCNCSICRRYGTLWAYCKASEVRVIGARGATNEYSWGDKSLRFVRCCTCGCITHWERINPTEDSRMGVNARNFEPNSLGSIRIRLLDGASTWKYLDQPPDNPIDVQPGVQPGPRPWRAGRLACFANLDCAHPCMMSFTSLLGEVRRCTLCSERLPLGPRPILQLHPHARILVAGQAPGRKVHESGVPFADASGDRLRDWLGITPEIFYDPQRVSILPMGFCFPGTGKSGDLPPRPECAPAWREKLMRQLGNLRLTLVIGQYAQAYHFPDAGASVTSTVQSWREHWPDVVPLPHPSPRNNLWIRRNPWFESELLPLLRARVAMVLEEDS